MTEVTSIVRDRGRALGVVVAVAMSAALLTAPMAFGAGDPVASGTFKLKLSSGFKKQLKKNHVKIKPKKFSIQGGSNLDPTTGAGLIRLGKIKFKKGGKKYVFKNVKATLGANGGKGNIASSQGKIFKLSGGTLVRNGFGADLTGVKAKFLKSAAKKVNKKLGLHSLHPGKAGSVSASEQPKTVEVTGGTAVVNVPTAYLPPFGPLGGGDPNTVPAKQPSHCISPALGAAAIAPATLTAFPDLPDTTTAARFNFPVTGGTVGPAGNAGAIQLAGGVRLQTGHSSNPSIDPFAQPSNCAQETPGVATSHSWLETTNLAPNLGLGNVQSHVVFGGTQPGCNLTGETASCPTAVFPGDKGVAIGQKIDLSGATVTADPTAKKVSIAGALITNNALSATTLSALFPDASGTHPWADGDKFGISTLNVTTR